MQVWTTARARATIGGPSFESRTPCNAAAFQRRHMLSPEANTSSGSPPNTGAAAASAPHFRAVRRVRRNARSLTIPFLSEVKSGERRRRGASAQQSLVDGYLTFEKNFMEC